MEPESGGLAGLGCWGKSGCDNGDGDDGDGDDEEYDDNRDDNNDGGDDEDVQLSARYIVTSHQVCFIQFSRE